MSWPWGHPVVLNKGPLDWESSTLATRPLFKGGRIVRQTTKANMEGCFSFTCCFSWTLGSSSKCDQLKPFLIGITLVNVPQLAQRVLLPFSRGGLLIILMHCMIFLSPVPDVARMYMLTVSFLTQLDSEYLSSRSKICIQLPSKVGFKTTKYCCMKDMEVHTKLQWHIKLRSKNGLR